MERIDFSEESGFGYYVGVYAVDDVHQDHLLEDPKIRRKLL